MPIYEYRCQSCGHELEKLQRLSDPVLTECPECGKAKLRRLISAAGFRLKGAGWYETDFKQGNKRNLAESAGGKGDGAAKTDSASDTPTAVAKAEPKAEPKPEPVASKSKTSSSATDSA
jgi:putative FmdB family regulatory protein